MDCLMVTGALGVLTAGVLQTVAVVTTYWLTVKFGGTLSFPGFSFRTKLHFGLFRYCPDGDGDCEDIPSNLELDLQDAVRGTCISAIIVTGIAVIVTIIFYFMRRRGTTRPRDFRMLGGFTGFFCFVAAALSVTGCVLYRVDGYDDLFLGLPLKWNLDWSYFLSIASAVVNVISGILLIIAMTKASSPPAGRGGGLVHQPGVGVAQPPMVIPSAPYGSAPYGTVLTPPPPVHMQYYGPQQPGPQPPYGPQSHAEPPPYYYHQPPGDQPKQAPAVKY